MKKRDLYLMLLGMAIAGIYSKLKDAEICHTCDGILLTGTEAFFQVRSAVDGEYWTYYYCKKCGEKLSIHQYTQEE